ncbi:hypothetical protein EB118_05310 [bacterium]|nr:hypothetical protein [bacterium]NDC93754.1 hypothetical protein [bacterium]NDD83087.1 hypothetical protein [bacterium]NDG29502.1 hypothetical protein [bacterium]
MNLDENDILSTNVFVNSPDLTGEVDPSVNDSFRRYYRKTIDESEERKLRQSLDRISLRSVSLTDETDESNILNTNSFRAPSIASVASAGVPSVQSVPSAGAGASTGAGVPGGVSSTSTGARAAYASSIESKRLIKEIKTYVSIDSRDRNKVVYPKAGKFKVFLGRSFYNVRSIRLASMEFPNTNAVINSNNNMIYWRNKEDIDTDTTNSLTNMYPVYSVQIRIGSYIASTLQTEMTTTMDLVKRRNGVGDFHYFDITLDISTDIVTFTSLTLTQLPNNPISTTIGLGILKIFAPAHGYSTGDTVYLLGAKTIAGIATSTINTDHKITVLNVNEFTIEVNVKAADTVQGGGNVVNTGKIAPFQLLFGEYSNTIAQNIGYPLENSSEKIQTYIKSIENLYQVKITFTTPHNLTVSNIGSVCTVASTGTIPSIDGTKVITGVPTTNSIQISVDQAISISVFNQGELTVNGVTYTILQIDNVLVQTVIVTTFTKHNYTNSIITTQVNLAGTNTIPSLDGDNVLFGVLSDTQLIFPGYILSDVSSSYPSNEGYFAQNKPLTTYTVPISSISISGALVTIVCTQPHNLQVSDVIYLNNVNTVPLVTTTRVFLVPSPTVIVINSTVTSYDEQSVSNGKAFIGTGLVTVTFPDHKFNKIVSVLPSNTPNVLVVQTQLAHNYTVGQKVRLSQTNSVPSVDGGYTIQSVPTTDTFTILFGAALTTPATSGVMRYNQDFYIYGATTVGEMSSTSINGTLFTLRDIIDKDTFTFYNNNAQAQSIETGGGNNVFISSLIHGFNGIQTNTKNDLLNRSINLQGENYAFLCCPQLSTMLNTGNVRNIFARITLDQSPGNMVFSFLSNPKDFTTVPLDNLNELEFSIVNYDGSFYEFNDLDYSFTLEIIEQIDITESFNISSKRGIAIN